MKGSRRVLSVLLTVILLVQVSACGTILYPDRRGQAAGKYDTDIVILDAVGLLFFLVPGVIAFAVDFATGAIYLPKGEKSKINELLGQMQIHKLELQTPNAREVAAVIEEHTGVKMDHHLASLIIFEGRQGTDIKSRLLELNLSIADAGYRRPPSDVSLRAGDALHFVR